MEDFHELRCQQSRSIVLDFEDLDEARENREDVVDFLLREEVVVLGGENGEDLEGSLRTHEIRESSENREVIEKDQVSRTGVIGGGERRNFRLDLSS